MTNHKTAIAVAKAVALMLVASSAQAQVTNLVTNGSFEQTFLANGVSSRMFINHATGWDAHDGWTFLVAPGKADVQMWDGSSETTLKLWSTNNGGPNVVPATSPDGGRLVVADVAFLNNPITQTINGLTVGSQYKLNFFYAAGQQYTYDGPTTEAWQVSLGGQTYQTPTINLGNHNFADWRQASFTYTATASSEVLSFIAVGAPQGAPPFALLDGVSLTAPVPEPEEWAMMLVGAGLVSWQVRRKQAAKLTA